MKAVDTNVLLYSIDLDYPEKREIAIGLIDDKPAITSQNLSVFFNVLLKRWKYPKNQIGLLGEEVLRSCIYNPLNKSTYLRAFELTGKYDFQIFDAIIIASALEYNCEILFSEDFQHKIEGKLKIINPFI
jgi:predicted nucleic acid-binding protein